ncbi:MAG: flotillin-like FloA family protein, partial [Spirochaetaceae bacterium]|nr:flotillin-like FloA family protein [Spirochaetaceae bacterium]
MGIFIFVLYAAAAILGLFFVIILIKFFGLWLRALVSGASVGLGRLVGMWIRKVNARVVVDSRIMLVKG